MKLLEEELGELGLCKYNTLCMNNRRNNSVQTESFTLEGSWTHVT
jgi:hypothetical protein